MKHISIVGKFMAIMALFGIFAIAIAGYSSSRIYEINGSYGDLLHKESTASLSVARANRSIQMARAAIGDLLMSRTPEGNAAATAELQHAQAGFSWFCWWCGGDMAVCGTRAAGDYAGHRLSVSSSCLLYTSPSPRD